MDNVIDLIKDKAVAATTFSEIETALVKACSRQIIAPKPKHIRTILVYCNNRVTPMSDIFKVLDGVLKEPHWAVVFKTLITIHILTRDSCGDRVLGYLAAQPNILNLSSFRDKTNTAAGVEQAKNIRSYASYLEEKVASFRELKSDYCRDSNGELAKSLHAKPPGDELFKHVKTLIRLSSSLLSCKFYLDELDNPITMDAFRYLIRDLMSIYRALAKGCLKVLESYFDMSKANASISLGIYESYVEVNEKVIDFFKVAKRVESAISNEIPDITPTPANLTATLKQYLDNYEENHRAESSAGARASLNPVNNTPFAAAAKPSNNSNLLDLFGDEASVSQPSFQQHSTANPFATQSVPQNMVQSHQQQPVFDNFDPFSAQQQQQPPQQHQQNQVNYAMAGSAFSSQPFNGGFQQNIQRQGTYPNSFNQNPFSTPPPFPVQQQQQQQYGVAPNTFSNSFNAPNVNSSFNNPFNAVPVQQPRAQQQAQKPDAFADLLGGGSIGLASSSKPQYQQYQQSNNPFNPSSNAPAPFMQPNNAGNNNPNNPFASNNVQQYGYQQQNQQNRQATNNNNPFF